MNQHPLAHHKCEVVKKIVFLLGFSSLANHGGYLKFLIFFLPTTNNPQVGC
jgi:hypothetical protein